MGQREPCSVVGKEEMLSWELQQPGLVWLHPSKQIKFEFQLSLTCLLYLGSNININVWMLRAISTELRKTIINLSSKNSSGTAIMMFAEDLRPWFGHNTWIWNIVSRCWIYYLSPNTGVISGYCINFGLCPFVYEKITAAALKLLPKTFRRFTVEALDSSHWHRPDLPSPSRHNHDTRLTNIPGGQLLNFEY